MASFPSKYNNETRNLRTTPRVKLRISGRPNFIGGARQICQTHASYTYMQTAHTHTHRCSRTHRPDGAGEAGPSACAPHPYAAFPHSSDGSSIVTSRIWTPETSGIVVLPSALPLSLTLIKITSVYIYANTWQAADAPFSTLCSNKSLKKQRRGRASLEPEHICVYSHWPDPDVGCRAL